MILTGEVLIHSHYWQTGPFYNPNDLDNPFGVPDLIGKNEKKFLVNLTNKYLTVRADHYFKGY